MHFNNFICENALIDLPLNIRRFTWFRCDGISMSCLDRFLLSEGWIQNWPHSSQWGLSRGLSDHCPLLLKNGDINWGPKPFRFLNAWKYQDGFDDFVKNSWCSFSVRGWGGYVLKEKLSCLKIVYVIGINMWLGILMRRF
jgi:hypothetical protein